MKAEIIAVGTELLLGQILNTNAQYLAQECALLGIDVYFQTVVGDNPARIREALEQAGNRADLVIMTGGLGPTLDDLTKDVLADMTGRKLYLDEATMVKIQELFNSQGLHMVESNSRQANMIEGAEPIPNDTGLAIGLGLVHEETRYLLLPGPPKEMKPMFERYAKHWLSGIMTDELPLHSKMLKFAGIGESTLEHKLFDLIEKQTDPTIAPYAKEGEVTIRLATKAHSEEEAWRKMAEIEEEIRSRVGEHIYAQEDVPIEEVVLAALQSRNQTLTTAESCTGGLLSDLITSVPGRSSVFLGGVVSYSNELKHSMLNVPVETLEGEDAPGAVSPETAEAMVRGLLEKTDCDYAVSVTGVAGPTMSEGKPIGLVYVGVGCKNGDIHIRRLQLPGLRETIKLRAAKSALYELWKLVKSDG
ncbi:competence/damage-inducible protein A [Paenibacillus lutrae]|uniref:Putative competence-damage inducible protein n=1 Tax=Paenibacillus lutrae TaxID=2078573 RepID=A0A7X3FG01_9BACL|nr:competence/damage-inducible protein A [Paenibacillus lutrae]MVO99085.1 competence/damage-inducible protein A [Paenibacillus lutrae]